jgi:hypothetical protein
VPLFVPRFSPVFMTSFSPAGGHHFQRLLKGMTPLTWFSSSTTGMALRPYWQTGNYFFSSSSCTATTRAFIMSPRAVQRSEEES